MVLYCFYTCIINFEVILTYVIQFGSAQKYDFGVVRDNMKPGKDGTIQKFGRARKFRISMLFGKDGTFENLAATSWSLATVVVM